MPATKCGNCGHKHTKHCKHDGCLCNHPSRHLRPAPDFVRLKEHMDHHGLSFREIARRSGVDVSQVWRVLNGHSNPSYGTLKKLAQGMGFTLEYTTTLLGIRWRKV